MNSKIPINATIDSGSLSLPASPIFQKEKSTYAANFAMIEYLHPSVVGAHFKGTDSEESPGLTSGISYKELEESMK